MKMTGFICHDHYLNKLAKLSDQEVGRLMRALMTYHASGEVQELAGRESIAFDFIKEDIDRAEAAYKEKCDTNRRNRTSTTVNDRQRTSTNDDERPQININKKEKEENINDGDDTRARVGEYTEDEIKQHREDLGAVEDYARLYGLPVNIGNLQTAEELIAAYGADWVIQAIQTAGNGKEQTWRYVRGILEKAKRDGGFKKPAEKKPTRTVNGQDYEQRDYSGKKAAMPDWMIAGMKELEHANV